MESYGGITCDLIFLSLRFIFLTINKVQLITSTSKDCSDVKQGHELLSVEARGSVLGRQLPTCAYLSRVVSATLCHSGSDAPRGS